MNTDVAPALAEFGGAVFDAQVLEQGLRLAIALASSVGQLPPASSAAEPRIRGLHDLIQAAKKRGILDETHERQLADAKRIRNELIHVYMTARAPQMATPRGRQQVMGELVGMRTLLQRARGTIDSLIDRYLEPTGLSLDEVMARLEPTWIDGESDPFLH